LKEQLRIGKDEQQDRQRGAAQLDLRLGLLLLLVALGLAERRRALVLRGGDERRISVDSGERKREGERRTSSVRSTPSSMSLAKTCESRKRGTSEASQRRS